MQEFKEAIFGAYTYGQLFGFMWFILIGYLYNYLDETSGRDKTSPRTPIKWSWRFWFFDNWRRYLMSILATYIFFRFYVEFTGHEITYFECAMIGIVGDNIGMSAKKKIGFIKADREKLLKEEPDKNKP
jgi:hypothetical protein